VGGITPDPENPGFRNTIFRLWCAPYLESGKASVITPEGTVSSEWIQTEGNVTWEIEIPDSCTGEVWTLDLGSGWVSEQKGPGKYKITYSA
jgi:hypothetical protein